LRLTAGDPYVEKNLCPSCSDDNSCEYGIRFEPVQTKGPAVTLTVTNVSAYYPVWPKADPADPGKLSTSSRGYLDNGLKSGERISDDLFQLNVCRNRRVKTSFCFRNSAGQKVTMERAAYRIFDVDHSATPYWNGPETFQFNCTGGTFSVFGDHPYMNYDKPPVLVERGVTINGQDKLTYLCPENDLPVTMWSGRAAEATDNPTSSSLDTLTKVMESSMVLINYANVDCFDITFASMPPNYHQLPWTNPTTKEGSPGFDEGLNASAGGNPLNSSTLLIPANFPGLEEGDCSSSEGGRSWLMAGLADKSGVTAPCTTVSISNDPMFVVNGIRRHFWLPTNKNTKLMEWEAPAGGRSHKFSLSGDTFGHGPSQWFRSYVIRVDGKELMRVRIADGPKKEPLSKTARDRSLRTIDLWVDAKPVTTIGKSVKSVRVQDMSALPSVQVARLIGSTHAETVEIHAPGLALTIASAGANKYDKEAQKVRWAHLNLKVRSSLPSSASGLVAELAGVKPLSKTTKGYLKVPKAVKAHRERRRQSEGHKGSNGALLASD
jgi:hypothetical protein